MRFSRTLKATADSTGAAQLDLQMAGNVDAVVLLAVISAVMPSEESTTQASAVQLVNGTPIDFTDSGNRDQSPQRTLLRSGDVTSIVWTGADPGAACKVTFSGIQYPYGTAPQE